MSNGIRANWRLEFTAIWSRFLAPYLHTPQSLHDLKNKIDADPVHRSQLEIHGRVLRDRGIVVSNALVEAVVEALLRENTPTA